MKCNNRFIIFFLAALSAVMFNSCSKDDEEVRMPGDILGIWMVNDNEFIEFGSDYSVHKLILEENDGVIYGEWQEEVFYYEPGYNLVVYLDSRQKASIYEVVSLTPQTLTWCWVKELEVNDASTIEEIGNVIGDVIKDAQEGFTLNPELYQTFSRISKEEFQTILDDLGIIDPFQY